MQALIGGDADTKRNRQLLQCVRAIGACEYNVIFLIRNRVKNMGVNWHMLVDDIKIFRAMLLADKG